MQEYEKTKYFRCTRGCTHVRGNNTQNPKRVDCDAVHSVTSHRVLNLAPPCAHIGSTDGAETPPRRLYHSVISICSININLYTIKKYLCLGGPPTRCPLPSAPFSWFLSSATSAPYSTRREPL